MNGAWFDPNVYAWIPGTALGVLGGLYGSLVGLLAPQGKAKGFVLGLHATLLIASGVLLATAVLALVAGQPFGVWYGLGQPGVIGLVLFAALFPVVQNAYRMAERRKMAAQDLPL
jgi:hypothetical protein